MDIETTTIHTSEAGSRRVDFSHIIDTMVAVGIFVVVFTWAWATPHRKWEISLAATLVWLGTATTSVILHHDAEKARQKRSYRVYRITKRTLATLEQVK